MKTWTSLRTKSQLSSNLEVIRYLKWMITLSELDKLELLAPPLLILLISSVRESASNCKIIVAALESQEILELNISFFKQLLIIILRAQKEAVLILLEAFTRYSQNILKLADMYLSTSFQFTPFVVAKFSSTYVDAWRQEMTRDSSSSSMDFISERTSWLSRSYLRVCSMNSSWFSNLLEAKRISRVR